MKESVVEIRSMVAWYAVESACPNTTAYVMRCVCVGGFGGRGVGKQHGTSWQPTCVNGCILVMPRTRASECSSASGVWSFELRLVCAVLAAATARCDLTLIVHRVHVAYEVPAQCQQAQ